MNNRSLITVIPLPLMNNCSLKGCNRLDRCPKNGGFDDAVTSIGNAGHIHMI